MQPTILNDYPLEGVNQIVGHTPQKTVKDIICGKVTHYLVDCLFDDCDEVLVLDIEKWQGNLSFIRKRIIDGL